MDSSESIITNPATANRVYTYDGGRVEVNYHTTGGELWVPAVFGP